MKTSLQMSHFALVLSASLPFLADARADLPYFHGGSGYSYSEYQAACHQEARSVVEARMIGNQLDILRTRPDHAPVACRWLKEMQPRLQFFSSREEIVVDRAELLDNGLFYQHHWMPGGAALIEEKTVLSPGSANCGGILDPKYFESQFGERVNSCEQDGYYCNERSISCTFWKFGKNPVKAATESFDRLVKGIDELCGDSNPESIKRNASKLLDEGVRPLDEAQNHILPRVCDPADISPM